MKTSGIYRLYNTVNGHSYIGSSVSLVQRKCQHKKQLERGTHENQHLQRAYNKYGKEAFQFEVLITCHPDNLVWYEQQFLDTIKPEYNMRKLANSNAGITLPSMRGRHLSDVTKEKLRQAHLGRITPLHVREAISKSRLGKHMTEELRIKFLWTRKGKKNTEIHNQRISKAHIIQRDINLISPSGEIHLHIPNLKQFIRDLGITSSGSFYELINGKRKMAYGWRVYVEPK